MDKRYEVYCLMDTRFYDTPARARGDDTAFAQARRPAPDTWQRSELDDWIVLRPDGARLPLQGWKIHVSACLDNAARILTDVWDYCVPRRIPFKLLPGKDELLLANATYAHRGSAGKFVCPTGSSCPASSPPTWRRGAARVADLPYRLETALHFSTAYRRCAITS